MGSPKEREIRRGSTRHGGVTGGRKDWIKCKRRIWSFYGAVSCARPCLWGNKNSFSILLLSREEDYFFPNGNPPVNCSKVSIISRFDAKWREKRSKNKMRSRTGNSPRCFYKRERRGRENTLIYVGRDTPTRSNLIHPPFYNSGHIPSFPFCITKTPSFPLLPAHYHPQGYRKRREGKDGRPPLARPKY